MTYRDYMTDKVNKNHRINRYLIVNVTFAFLVVMIFMDSMVGRTLFIGITGVLGLILSPFIRKSFITNRLKRKFMVAEYGNEEILAKGDDYYGFFTTEKKWHALLLLVYLIILLICITIVYDALEMSAFAIIIVDALHVLFLSPIFYIMRHGLFQSAIFTSSKIIIRDAVVIEFNSPFKHQFFELVNGKYILEINSGERFQRFCLEAEAHSKIVSLI